MAEILDVLSQEKTIPGLRDDIKLSEISEVLAGLDRRAQMRYILENLTEGPAKCEFKVFPPYEGEISLESLPLEDRDIQMLKDAIKPLIEYCALPIITDGFEEIPESIVEGTGRRGWRSAMEKLFGTAFLEVYEQNKIRFNKVAGLIIPLENVKYVLETYYFDIPQLEEIATLNSKLLTTLKEIAPSADAYAKFKLAEKKTKVREIDQIIREFLDKLSKPTTHSTL